MVFWVSSGAIAALNCGVTMNSITPGLGDFSRYRVTAAAPPLSTLTPTTVAMSASSR